MKKLTSLFIGLFFLININAQDIHFSNIGLIPSLINPAWNYAIYDDIYGGLIFRNQGFTATPNPYQTYGAFAQYSNKIKRKSENRLTFQGMFLSDQSGAASLGMTEANLGIAYHIALDNYADHIFSVGIQGGFNQIGFNDANSLVFEEDLTGSGFVENIENLNKQSLKWKFGLMQNSQLTENFSIGIGGAIGKLNYLNQSTTGNENIMKYSFHLSAEKYFNDYISFMPRFYYQKTYNYRNSVIQGILSYKSMNHENLILQFGLGLRFQDAAMILIGTEIGSWKVGFSYDINISDLAIATNYASGIEFGVMYSYKFPKKVIKIKKIKFKKKKPVKIEKEPIISLIISIFEKEKPLSNATVLVNNEITVDSLIEHDTSFNIFTKALVKERRYKIIAKKEGYFPDTSYLLTYMILKDTTIKRKIELSKIPVVEPVQVVKGKPARLDLIYYDYNDYHILPESEPQLQTIYRAMIKYPELKIEISSHTDSRGYDEYNLELSKKRAKSVIDWLTSKGIDKNRLFLKGYGESKLLNHCKNGVKCSEDEHRVNRRTEFRIIEGPEVIYLE